MKNDIFKYITALIIIIVVIWWLLYKDNSVTESKSNEINIERASYN